MRLDLCRSFSRGLPVRLTGGESDADSKTDTSLTDGRVGVGSVAVIVSSYSRAGISSETRLGDRDVCCELSSSRVLCVALSAGRCVAAD